MTLDDPGATPVLSAPIPPEATLRLRRELARAMGDDALVAHFSRLLWRYYVRRRYVCRVNRRRDYP